MSGFVAVHPSAPAPAEQADTVENDGWFPSLKLSDVRDSARIDGTVTMQRLRDAIVFAILDLNRQLAVWRERQEAAGHAALAEIPGPTVDGRSRLEVLYVRAVRCAVSADLMEHYRNFDASGESDRRADAADPAIAEQWRNARWAVRDILGQTHTTVELI